MLVIGCVACGGSVEPTPEPSAPSTGGASTAATGGAAFGGTVGQGGRSGVGGAALGGMVSAGGSLPARCGYPFDPGYACSVQPPGNFVQFDATSRRCVTVQYNGCGGATSGIFSDSSQCQALCEQQSSDASCPVYISESSCSVEGALCTYGSARCLCRTADAYGCLVDDPRCSSTSGILAVAVPPCTDTICTAGQRILVITTTVCTCKVGTWQCVSLFA